MTLPPYTGDSERCAKCWNYSASTTYVPRGWVDRVRADLDDGGSRMLEEHLLRVCDRCGYYWREALALGP